MKPLYKTTIVIWSKYDTSNADLSDIGYEATSGDSFLAKCTCDAVQEPMEDPNPPAESFFADPDDLIDEIDERNNSDES